MQASVLSVRLRCPLLWMGEGRLCVLQLLQLARAGVRGGKGICVMGRCTDRTFANPLAQRVRCTDVTLPQ